MRVFPKMSLEMSKLIKRVLTRKMTKGGSLKNERIVDCLRYIHKNYIVDDKWGNFHNKKGFC